MTQFVAEIRKSIVAGIGAGLLAFQAGGTWQTSVAAGVVAALGVWAVPNATPA